MLHFCMLCFFLWLLYVYSDFLIFYAMSHSFPMTGIVYINLISFDGSAGILSHIGFVADSYLCSQRDNSLIYSNCMIFPRSCAAGRSRARPLSCTA